MKIRALLLTISLTGLLCGCREKSPGYDNSKLNLTISFFREVTAYNKLAAARNPDPAKLNESAGKAEKILGKLQALDRERSYRELQLIQETNTVISEIQQLIDRDRIAAAEEKSREARKKYPENMQIRRLRLTLPQLTNADDLLKEMAEADNSSQMRAAYENARIGLSRNMTPELEKTFEAYRRSMERLTKVENERTRKEALQAEQAGKKADEAEKQRFEADRKNKQTVAEKTAAGLKAKEDAGVVERQL